MSSVKGQFDKFLVVDCETSGFNPGPDPSKDYQAVSWGLIVSDVKTFKPIDGLYLEVKWNNLSKWSTDAEIIHGLSKSYLQQHGVTEAEAAEQIGGLLVEHFDIDTPITLMGTNVSTFDLPFLRKLLNAYDLPFKFSHRAMDTFSLSMGTVQAFTSDELFEIINGKQRGKHNALDDAAASLKTFETIKRLWDTL